MWSLRVWKNSPVTPSGPESSLCGNTLTLFSISSEGTDLLKSSISNEVSLGKLPFPGILSISFRFQIYLHTSANYSLLKITISRVIFPFGFLFYIFVLSPFSIKLAKVCLIWLIAF